MTKPLNMVPRACALAFALTLAAGCDTSVTNPGPIADEFLDDPTAQPAIVAGARRTLSDAFGSEGDDGGVVVYWGAAVAFEINPAGSTGSFGIPPQVQVGTLQPGPGQAGFNWESANRARFTAEHGIARINALAQPDQLRLAEITLYAGYASRLLGENFCGAVIPTVGPDGELVPGDSTAHTDYFTRAASHFTSALSIATAFTPGNATQTTARTLYINAALAGRAQVRASLATYALAAWTDAAADAAAVTSNTFAFSLPYTNADQTQYNYLNWSNGDSPYRAHTQWGTFYEWYSQTVPADSRVRVEITTRTGDAAVARFGGHVPWHPQRKYDANVDPINLASGWEMRLIEAEAALAAGQVAAAVGLMNQRRANLTLPAYDAGVSSDSAYTLLKLERQLELWLEARRLGDLRRWSDNGVPGNVRDGLYSDTNGDGITESTRVETMTSPVGRSICFPISETEKDSNPNIP